jgi:translation initiation factor IF-3
VNHRIRFPKIRVIDAEGEAVGVMTPDEGRALAREAGLDLVEVAPNARPPVCRIMDYGKYKYEQSKKQTKQKGPSLKTVQLRPKTDTHDLETKLGRAKKFLERGDKVKIVMRMRGRERAHPDRWIKMMREHFQEQLEDVGKIVSKPSTQGRAISMMVEPAS